RRRPGPVHARRDDARRGGRGGCREHRGGCVLEVRGATDPEERMSETEDPIEGEIRFDPIEEAIADIGEGRIVIVVDDADRENEGDFVMAAEKATPEAVNFMATHGRGIICLPCEGARLDELRIPLMVTPRAG